MVEIVFSDSAFEDLNQIMEFIARDSSFYAYQFSQEIIERTEQLKTYPLSGRMVPELQDQSIRELFFKSYRIIYFGFSPDKIFILRIIHGARNFPETI